MNEVRLSICIPTYNFAGFIGSTLASIVPQLVPGVEIVILDGGSTDETSAVVAGWQANCEAIQYHRQPARGGIDRDLARVVDLARGEYCWLFSADDLAEDGALARIFRELPSGHDLYLCTHSECSARMQPLIARYPILAIAADTSFDFSDTLQSRRYFELALTTEAFFGFIGSLIVRRERWLAVPLDEAFVGSCWAHAARLLVLLRDGMQLRYLDRPLLARRGDNDSFGSGGHVKRFALVIDGYHAIAAAVFGKNAIEAQQIRRVVAREFPLRHMLFLKEQAALNPKEDRQLLARLVAENFATPSLANVINRALFAVMPPLLWGHLRKLVHAARSAVGRRR